MTDNQTRSWIFLATAMASQNEPAGLHSISSIADGINHAVPTNEELLSSLTWLTDNGLVTKTGRSYSLTDKGKADYESASRQLSTLLQIWENVETILLKYQT